MSELLTLGAAAGNLDPQDARALHLGAVGRHARVAPAVADHAVGYELHSVVFVVSTRVSRHFYHILLQSKRLSSAKCTL